MDIGYVIPTTDFISGGIAVVCQHVYELRQRGYNAFMITESGPDEVRWFPKKGLPVYHVNNYPKNPDVLYVGTDIGAYVSLDRGRSWHVLANGLPSTFVSDIKIHPREDILVASTHGRGMYAMDVRELQQMIPEITERDVHLFQPESITMPSGFRSAGSANIVYYLKRAGFVTVQVKNADGNVLKTLEGTSDAGYNQAAWNLTTEVGEETERAEPGTYTIEVTQGDVTEEATIEVRR